MWNTYLWLTGWAGDLSSGSCLLPWDANCYKIWLALICDGGVGDDSDDSEDVDVDVDDDDD